MLRTIVKCVVLICCAGLALTMSTACKKKNPSGPTLTGTWRNLDSATAPFKYLILHSDQTGYALQTNAYNLHGVSSLIYAVDGDQITIPLIGSTAMYSYSVSNDTLYVSGPKGSLRLKKDADQNPDNWVRKITLSSVSASGSGFWFGPMDYTGTDYIIAGFFTKKLYAVNSTDNTHLDSTTAMSGTISSLTTIGSDPWISVQAATSKLRKINFATSAVSFTSAALPVLVLMSARNGSKILVFTSAGSFYNYDPATDAFTPVAAFPGLFSSSSLSGFIDMEYKDNKVYMLAFNQLLELDLAAGHFTQTYDIETNSSGVCVGICFDGSSFVTERIITSTGSGLDYHIDIAKFNLPQ